MTKTALEVAIQQQNDKLFTEYPPSVPPQVQCADYRHGFYCTRPLHDVGPHVAHAMHTAVCSWEDVIAPVHADPRALR